MIQNDSSRNSFEYYNICDHLKLLSYLERPNSYNEVYDLYFEYEPDLRKFLSILHTKAKNSLCYETIKKLFSFKVHPGIEPEKIHIISTIVGIRLKEQKFRWCSIKELAPEIGKLNEVFDGYLLFEEKADPQICVTRVWQKKPTTTLWYAG